MEWVTLDEDSPSGDSGDLAWREARIYGVHREVSQHRRVAHSGCQSTAQNTCYRRRCVVVFPLLLSLQLPPGQGYCLMMLQIQIKIQRPAISWYSEGFVAHPRQCTACRPKLLSLVPCKRLHDAQIQRRMQNYAKLHLEIYQQFCVRSKERSTRTPRYNPLFNSRSVII